MLNSVSRRLCRQCGDPLPEDANPHTFLCGACSQLNAKLKNRQNNKAWYAKNKEKRKAAYRQKHPKKPKVIQVEEPIQYPSPEKIRENVDRLLKRAEENSRLKRGPSYLKRYSKQSVKTDESTPRTIRTALISGREYVIETRGRSCGCFYTHSDHPF